MYANNFFFWEGGAGGLISAAVLICGKKTLQFHNQLLDQLEHELIKNLQEQKRCVSA